MKAQVVPICLLVLVFGFSSGVPAVSSDYQVTFATEECGGDTGFATVGIDKIHKIQSAGCVGADGRPLKQLLVRNGSGSYDIFTVTEDEAVNITDEIKAYMASRRGILDRSDAIIVNP